MVRGMALVMTIQEKVTRNAVTWERKRGLSLTQFPRGKKGVNSIARRGRRQTRKRFTKTGRCERRAK